LAGGAQESKRLDAANVRLGQPFLKLISQLLAGLAAAVQALTRPGKSLP
jgi:hypothetical protein